MSYGIMRAAKVKGGADVAGMEMHNLRKKESRSNPDIDRSRSDRNYSIGSYDGNMSFNARIEQQIRERYKGSRAIRKDANKCVELLFTSDRDFMDSLNPEQERAFFKDCYDFTARHFGGQENIIADVVHKDEIGAAHMHIDFVPLTADGRLSAKDYLGGKKELQELQDSFFEEVAKKWGLERGSRANLDAGERGRKHLTPQELKAQTEAEAAELLQEATAEASKIVSKAQKQAEAIKDSLIPVRTEYKAKKAYVEAMSKDFDLISGVEEQKNFLGKPTGQVLVPKKKWETQSICRMDRDAQKQADKAFVEGIREFKKTGSAKKMAALSQRCSELESRNESLAAENRRLAVDMEKLDRVLQKLPSSVAEAFRNAWREDGQHQNRSRKQKHSL